jgi:flagellar protein FlaG
MGIDSLSSSVTTTPVSVQAQARPSARAEPTVSVQTRAPGVESKQIYRAAESINRQLQTVAPNLRFSVDEDTGKTVVRVVDTGTGETIRQVPSEEVLAISRSIDRLQGLLFHQEV